MAIDPSPAEMRLESIELTQKRALAALVKLESRVEILHREFLRMETLIHRLRLSDDSAKSAARRREKLLTEIRDHVDGLRAGAAGE